MATWAEIAARKKAFDHATHKHEWLCYFTHKWEDWYSPTSYMRHYQIRFCKRCGKQGTRLF